MVEAGETLPRRVIREVQEETALAIEPVTLAGYREVVARDGDGQGRRHFVILAFAARWIAGEPKLNEELADGRWLEPAEVARLKTTRGLAEIVAGRLRAAQGGGMDGAEAAMIPAA